MAASTHMNDDWEIVFIDEDGEVVSGKASVGGSKENCSIESAPVAQSKQEVPVKTDILPKEIQPAEKEQKESTETEPAKPIPVRRVSDRPVPDCYRPTYAFKGSRLSSRDFHKQYAQAPGWSFSQLEPFWKVDESATKTDSKVDQELAQYSKESKARTAEQLKDNLLFPREQGCSADNTSSSRPGRTWQSIRERPVFSGMEQGESSRSGAERNNSACPEFPSLRPMMPLAPSLNPMMEESMQLMKNISRSDCSISLGSASRSVERKISLRHDSAVIVFLLERHSIAMDKAKAKLQKTFSGWNATFDFRTSFTSEEQMEILRRHSLCVKEMEFVRIGFVSIDDRGRALGVLDSERWKRRGPEMAARAWLY